MGIVEEELDECLYWIELLVETKTVDASRVKKLESEASELLAITVSSIKTARQNLRVVSNKGK
jgi:four helix bundle protein